MLEKLKTKIKENPETTKKVAIVGGALIGVTAVAAVIYFAEIEFPFMAEEVPTIEVTPE